MAAGGVREGARRLERAPCAACARHAAGLAGPVAAALAVHEDPGIEGAQDEPVEPRCGAELRIRGVEERADPVEAEAVHLVGGHPAADAGAGLQDADTDPGAGQSVGRRQAGDPGPDDDDVRVVCRAEHVPSPVRRKWWGLMPSTAHRNA